MKQYKVEINPKYIYSAGEMAKILGKSTAQTAKIIARDRDKVRGLNLLKSQMQGEGRQTKYFILGRNLIKFIEELKIKI